VTQPVTASYSAGRFITIEGIEGVGKTTNLNFVADYFRARGAKVVVTREPGGTEMGERIRDLILATPGEGLSNLGELLLMFAARAEHLSGLIRPALARGETVVCDRFSDATFAYQGGGRGLDMGIITALRDIVQGTLRPDLTLLLDASTDVSVERIVGRDWQDRFEQERGEFFSRVRQAYLAIAAQEPQRVRLIDASKPLDEVQLQISAALLQKFGKTL
jgi:dTMP kinase